MQESNKGILNRYDAAQPQGGDRLSPRLGFYLIDAVTPSSNYSNFLIAETRWRPDNDGLFTDGARHTIQLYALQLTAPNPATFNPYELIGGVIEVTGTRIVQSSPLGVPRDTIACDWSIIRNNHPKTISDLLRMAGNVSASKLTDKDDFEEPDTSFYTDGELDSDN